LRETLLPAAKRWPLDELMRAVRFFAERASRDVTFEYALIAGVNDRPRHADALLALAKGLRALVNLIPLNPTPGYDGRRPAEEDVRRFRDRLERGGLPATIRVEKGAEIAAACGQLAGERSSRAGPASR
jgi:23S rRNA (adenine2503-C2)-methyltransferase